MIDGTRLHLGIIIALITALIAWVFLWRTTLGYRVRAVGHNPNAAKYAGIPVKNDFASNDLLWCHVWFSGAILVFGSQSHRLITDGSSLGFTGSAGFNGIVAALFGGLHPLWTIPSSLLFGGLLVGASAMQRAIQIPSALVVGLNGLVVVFVVCSTTIREKIQRKLTLKAKPRR
ncbi:MAG: hypothetical protein CM15mP49_28630 [Actinomycetota bacterium]|nr:MAG: hypothetical protein CM15mP49_28630 [Actinomycetota bacterium]